MALTTFVAGNVLTAQQLNDSYAATGGLRPITPTSIAVAGGGSTGSVGADGKVTFSTTTSISLNGCFTSSFDNYRIVFTADSSLSSTELYFRVRAAGIDNTSSNYAWARISNGSGTSNPSSGTGSLNTFMNITPASGTYSSAHTFDVCMPRNASYNTVVVGQGMYFDALATNWFGANFFGITSVTTSYDGFTLSAASGGTLTGFVTVYGYFG